MKGKEKLKTSPSTGSCLGNDHLNCVLNEEQGSNLNSTDSFDENLVKDDAGGHIGSPHYHYYNSLVIRYGQVNDLENIVSNPVNTGNRKIQLSYVCGSVYGKQNRYAHIATTDELHIPVLHNTSVLNENITMFCDNKF